MQTKVKLVIQITGTILTFFVSCCAIIGTADRATMIKKWSSKPVTVGLLDDINRWANWYEGRPFEGKCVDQTEQKISILKEFGVPYKIVHCIVTRDDPWHPRAHRFLIGWAEGDWQTMDNGVVQDGVWPFLEVKKSTWGVINYRVEN